MSRYYDVVVKRNMYPESEDYLEPFGFCLCDASHGGVVRTYLLHQVDLVLTWPLTKRARAIVKQVIKEEMGYVTST